MAKKKKSTIKCDVESCKHQNTEEGLCELDEIKVSCECSNDDCKENQETICESFDCDEEVVDSSNSDPDVDSDIDDEESENESDDDTEIDSDDVEYEVEDEDSDTDDAEYEIDEEE